VKDAERRGEIVSDEIERSRDAARFGAVAMRRICSTMKVDVPLRELEQAALSVVQNSADATLTMTLETGSSLAGSPRPFDPEQRLERGHLVWLRLTGALLGYCFERTAALAVGRASPEQRAFLKHLGEATQWMMEVIRSGEKVEFVRTESRGRVIIPAAHGIGRQSDHAMAIESNQPCVLEAGQVLVVEPLVISRDFGVASASQTVAVLTTGTEILGLE
jgi:Xaa-Pro aminopeptidase